MALQCLFFVKYAVVYSDFKQSLDNSAPLKYRYDGGNITEATNMMTACLFWCKWLLIWYLPATINWYFRRETFSTRIYLAIAQILGVLAHVSFVYAFVFFKHPYQVGINIFGGIYWIKVMCVWAYEKRGIARNYATDIHEINYDD